MNSTSVFESFADRVREFIRVSRPGTRGPQSGRPPDSQARAFSELALRLFELQFRHNAPYRRYCQGRGVSPESIEHWDQIPAMPTSAFKELELSCLPPEKRTAVFHCSGTTGQQPSRHFHNAQSLEMYEASLLPWFQAHLVGGDSAWSGTAAGWKPAIQPGRIGALRALGNRRFEGVGKLRYLHNSARGYETRSLAPWRLAILTPPPAQVPHSSLVHMFETIRCRLGSAESQFLGISATDGTWCLDFTAALAALQEAVRVDQPLMLLGTAFSFVHLLDSLARHNVRLSLPLGSRAMETGGYKGRSRSLPKAELHALITAWLGIPREQIVCEYGMSELSSQAYDRVADGADTGYHASGIAPSFPRRFVFPPWARVQVVSPETGQQVGEGQSGLIRVFDLANIWSVMAIQSEDLGVRRGNGFELVGRAELAEPRGCSLMAV